MSAPQIKHTSLNAWLAAFAIFIVCGLSPVPAHAALATVICDVLYLVQGDIGRGATTLAILAIGAGAVMGKVSMHMAVTVAVGISILFSASTIAQDLGYASVC